MTYGYICHIFFFLFSDLSYSAATTAYYSLMSLNVGRLIVILKMCLLLELVVNQKALINCFKTQRYIYIYILNRQVQKTITTI